MLFTNIQLDNFLPTLAHFIERIEIEGAEECEWVMMAGTGGPAVKVAKKCQVAPAFHDENSEEKWMDVNDKGASQASPALSDANTPAEFPVSFKLALELAFSMLSFVLHNPTWKASPFAHSTLDLSHINLLGYHHKTCRDAFCNGAFNTLA
jgi:protein SMG6